MKWLTFWQDFSFFSAFLKNNYKIPESWLGEKIIGLDDYNGGIDELTFKIANIRTWTYIANQSHWIENNTSWQERTRNIEDNLPLNKVQQAQVDAAKDKEEKKKQIKRQNQLRSIITPPRASLPNVPSKSQGIDFGYGFNTKGSGKSR